MVIAGRYAMRRVVLTPGAEQSASRVSLTTLTERVHSDATIPPRRKCFLLMLMETVVTEMHWISPTCHRSRLVINFKNKAC
jgi:hypothetical protein